MALLGVLSILPSIHNRDGPHVDQPVALSADVVTAQRSAPSHQARYPHQRHQFSSSDIERLSLNELS
jgi:hypothetical protein